MTMVKSLLQPARQTDSYCREDSIAEAFHLSLENCNPNVANERTTTTAMRNFPKSPWKPKNRTPGDNDFPKDTPFRRTLDSDGEGSKKVTGGRSPGNSGGSNKEVMTHMGTPPRKHFCRSPRCSANNPDYSVSVPRTYLRSKRHLLPGWQSPSNAKAKVPLSPSIDQNRTSAVPQGVSSQELMKEDRKVVFRENMQISKDCACLHRAEGVSVDYHSALSSRKLEYGVANSVSAKILVLSSAVATSILQKNDEDRSSKNVSYGCMRMDPREALVKHDESTGPGYVANAEERDVNNHPSEGSSHRRTHGHRADREEIGIDCNYSTIYPIRSAPMYMDDEQEKYLKPKNDVCTQEMHDDLNIQYIPSALIGGQRPRECPPTSRNPEEVVLDVNIVDVMAHRGGRHIGGDLCTRPSCNVENLAGSDPRSSPVSPRRLSVRGYQKMRFRRFSTDGNGMGSSKEFVSLKRQSAMKRKQAKDWMWDCAVKEAVSRLASQGDGGVNVLVQAFESVNLTEKALEVSEHSTAIGHVSQKISNDQARYESMADAGEYGLSGRNVEQGNMDCGAGGCARGSDVMISTRDCEGLGIMTLPHETTHQERFPRLSSNSESSELGSNDWASFKNAATEGKNDACSLRGASSNTGVSDMSKWTCRRLSRSRCRTQYQRKRCTSLQPFKLLTEERGAVKEEVFSRRLQQLWAAEQRLRIPIAQGLPWTTDEPEVPHKPPVKEQTRAEEFRLETGFRAVERTEFDKYVAERQLQSELQRQEEERRRQVATEEDIKRLRQQMVPRAQLMPYFDRPFMPRRSSKRLTVPKQPNFHHTQHKRARCSMVSCYATNYGNSHCIDTR